MNKRQHKHHIDVQTDEELVTVTIGSDGGVPGGFAKLFNRVVDSEAWARLSDAGRAVYVPLVRFADHRNQFRVQIGRAGMMKYTGLSQSSIKRAAHVRNHSAIRSDERVAKGEIDLIVDHQDVAQAILGIHPAAGVGDDQQPAARQWD